MIKDSSCGDKFEVALAWEECTPEGKMPLDEFCAKFGVGKASSIEQVIDECDCLVVLSPDNVERHEDLTKLPLASGKPVYVDKPFAESLASGRRMVERAKTHNTPMMSSSALRFDSTVDNALKTIGAEPVNMVATRGPGTWEIYAIHQVEPMVTIMGTGASRVMQCGTGGNQIMVVEYPDQRRAVFNQSPAFPFQFNVQYGESGTITVNEMSDFFPRFIEAMLSFFDTGQPQAPPDQTLEITAILEAGTQALKTPGQWVQVPR
jgi:predicted dehydrogenase